ncbi:hypothetical protein [Paenibacillus tyrfis]|uniref:hypothetical protein n=1 Tax=Paenibacillus tyrfis TaxID=1501230 RepID=UPI001180A6F9|nr:hypothetical protein [Paenibacillus tyrfis]
MKKKILSAILSAALVCSFSSGIASAAATKYENTNLLNCWRVSTQGSVYTPVSLTARVLINSEQVSGQDFITMYREDLIAETLSQYWGSFPNASLNVGQLNIRGTGQSLPNDGTYWSSPSYRVVGKYNDSQRTFNLSSGASNGTAVFFVNSGGYQLNNTAQVDFTW